jgi:hypothetical protein
MNDAIKLREKVKDKEWYKYQLERYVPYTASPIVHDYYEMKKLYEFVNNDLSNFKDDIAYYCGSLEEYGATEEVLVPYNPIPNKLEVLKGDLLSRSFNHRILLLTAKAVRDKNEELINVFRQSIDEELRLTIEKQKAMMEGMPPEELDKYIQQLRVGLEPKDLALKTFNGEAEILYSKLLQHANLDQDVAYKKLETLEDLVTVSRVFLYTGWKNGRPYIKVLNPLHVGFQKSPDVAFIEKGDYVFHWDEITVGDALLEYQNRLDDEEIQKILDYSYTLNPLTEAHMTKPVFDHVKYYSLLTSLGEFRRKGIGTHQGNQLTNYNLNQTLQRLHLEFRAFEEVIFLTVKDEYNTHITLKANADIIPSTAAKVKFTNRWMEESTKYVWDDEYTGVTMEAEVLMIPRRYEVTRLGSDIIVDYREVPFQPDYGSNPFSKFELSYKGTILYNRNSKWLSLVQRAMPTAFQYMAAKRLQDREIAKYVGQERAIDVDQVPDELGMDHEGNAEMSTDPTLKAEVIARKTGTRFYSSGRNANGLPPAPTRSIGVNYNVVDTSPQLLNLQQFCSALDMEVGMRMGIPPQREAMSVPNTNVTDNRQALMQSSLATQTLFYTLDMVWAHALNEHVMNMRTYIKNYLSQNPNLKTFDLEYVLPDGTKEYLQVEPDHVDQLEDLGLYLYDNGREQVYFNYMLQSVFSFAQNAGQGVEQVSSVLKALTSTTSVEEMHKIISTEARALQDRVQKQQEQQQQLIEEQKKAMRELEEYRASLKLESDIAKIQEQRISSREIAEIQSQALANQYDIDKNKENDLIQRDRERMAHETSEKQKDRNLQIELARIKGSSVKKD